MQACPSRRPGTARAVRVGPSQSCCLTPEAKAGQVPAVVTGRGKPSLLNEAGLVHLRSYLRQMVLLRRGRGGTDSANLRVGSPTGRRVQPLA